MTAGRGSIRRAGRRLGMAVPFACVLVLPVAAMAQARRPPAAPRGGGGVVELSAGVTLAGGMDLGARDAEETRNINTGTGPFTLFATASRTAPAPAADLRVGVYVTRAISVEGGLQYARPRLITRLSGDAEQAPPLSAEETVSRYLASGSLVVHLPGLTFAGGRGVPFVAGGGGYLRELHQQNEMMETGREYHAGGGVKLWMGGARPRLGVRLEGGASSRAGGIDFRGGRRTMGTAGAALVYRF